MPCNIFNIKWICFVDGYGLVCIWLSRAACRLVTCWLYFFAFFVHLLWFFSSFFFGFIFPSSIISSSFFVRSLLFSCNLHHYLQILNVVFVLLVSTTCAKQQKQVTESQMGIDRLRRKEFQWRSFFYHFSSVFIFFFFYWQFLIYFHYKTREWTRKMPRSRNVSY